ncbi:vasoactive intestinal polypeptide receptor 2 [Prionailurus iriomotensis]
MRAPALLPPALLTCCGWLLAPSEEVNSVHPECRFHLEIQEEETKCAELLRTQTEKYKGHMLGPHTFQSDTLQVYKLRKVL